MRLTRRDALAGAGGAMVAGAVARVGYPARSSATPRPARAFDGGHQAGILTPRQAHLTLAAFDLVTPDRDDVPRLLTEWTALTAALCERDAAPAGDTGERHGLGPRGLTVTIGLAGGVFDDRYGWGDRRPAGLAAAPSGMAGGLDPRRGGGDLVLQVCGDDRQVVFHAVHQFANAALGIARRRWTQHGFVSAPQDDPDPRAVIGFRDGTGNLSIADAAGLAQHVWVAPGRDRDGMAGGTYLVYRRIRVRLQAWDRTSVGEQEQVVGRRKSTGAALRDPRPRAHVQAMAAAANGGVRVLRRSYNYDDGATADGDADAGMAFICFVADPAGFGRLARRFDRDDDLRRYAIPTAAGVFAVPPAPAPGEHIGQRLLA